MEIRDGKTGIFAPDGPHRFPESDPLQRTEIKAVRAVNIWK